MPTGKLELACFASEPHVSALSDALARIGWPAAPVEGRSWAGESGLEVSTVLLLQRGAYAPVDLLDRLKRATDARVLAIFTCDDPNWDRELIARCGDFLGWPCHDAELLARLERVFGPRPGASDPGAPVTHLDEFVRLNLLGASPVFLHALETLRRYARCEAPVLVRGETGTGKELAARAIHFLSARRDGPFIPLNCGAIPDNLFENEVFGHERGAFTDARERQPGLVERAEKGTLFLDEVDALSEKGQVTLLRFLEEQEYRPLGGRGYRKADVRVVAATHVDLGFLSARGCFRQDLTFRLQVLTVHLPPLRERGADVRLLAEHHLERYRARFEKGRKFLDPAAHAWMASHPWSGNVRELENLLLRAYLLAEGPVIRTEQLNPSPAATAGGAAVPDDGRKGFRASKARAVAAFERTYLESLLVDTGGNLSEAARIAGTDRTALRRLLRKHGVSRHPGRRRRPSSPRRPWGETDPG